MGTEQELLLIQRAQSGQDEENGGGRLAGEDRVSVLWEGISLGRILWAVCSHQSRDSRGRRGAFQKSFHGPEPHPTPPPRRS